MPYLCTINLVKNIALKGIKSTEFSALWVKLLLKVRTFNWIIWVLNDNINKAEKCFTDGFKIY